MTFVIERGEADEVGETVETPDDGPCWHLGAYRALDGSSGAPIYVGLDRPHVAVVVEKRGYRKSYNLCVLAERPLRATGTAPMLVDPVGAVRSMAWGRAGNRSLRRSSRSRRSRPTRWIPGVV